MKERMVKIVSLQSTQIRRIREEMDGDMMVPFPWRQVMVVEKGEFGYLETWFEQLRFLY